MTLANKPNIPIAVRLLAVVALLALVPPFGLLASQRTSRVPPALIAFGRLAHTNPAVYGAMFIGLFVILVLFTRALMDLWFNRVRPRIAGIHENVAAYAFTKLPVDLLGALAAMDCAGKHAGLSFVGLEPKQGRLARFAKGTPRFISDEQRTMHLHCLGQTGCGKTQGALFPFVMQDMRAGKGVLIADGKGSNEHINTIRNLCEVTGRTADLRIFSLTFPDLSHTYNPMWIEPRTPAKPAGGDPLAVAERIFSVFKVEMQEMYYKNLGESLFRSLICVLHGIVDDTGESLPFTFVDVLECLQNREALTWCLTRTIDRPAALNIQSQITNLGDRFGPSLMGLQNMVQKYADLPLLNATAPDIVLEEVLEKNLIVYFQLPANYYGNLTLDIGKIVLQDLQQAGSRRQVFRDHLNQRPFGVFIDEFSNFAFPGMISALNKLRDANLQFFLAHQTLADLEMVSKEFCAGIWDNTRTKLILFQNNPQLCEQLSKSLGTYETVKSTSRASVGELALRLNMGEQSLREVEEFRLHPNRIKSLAARGQAYLVEGSDFIPLNLGRLPPPFFSKRPQTPLAARRPSTRAMRLRERVRGELGGVA
jgi:intracellular multiplication protein IcmO